MTTKDKELLTGLAISVACEVLPVRKVPSANYIHNVDSPPELPEDEEE